ncbi:MAG: HAD-IC family P-type ATPase [archaeon]
MSKEANNFHTLSIEQTLKELNTAPNGLTKEKAKTLRLKYGLNKLPEKKRPPIILLFIRQFKSSLIYILIAAGVISFLLDRIVDAYVILAVILINASIGFFQESKAEKAIKALKKMIVPQADVYRNGELVRIPAKEIVPGDILSLEEGDKIPADARLIELKNLRTVESSLTGESFPVDKLLKILPLKTPLADRKNMVFLGTFVASGHAKAVVVHTGADTTIGKLASSIESIKPKRSHFQEKTDTLAKYMALIAVIGALANFTIGYFFRDFELSEIFLFALASLVSGIPEGLPAVLAIVLAIGAFRMAKRKAVIRHRYATETLNVVDTIVTDKTGTLTENTMTIQEIFLPEQKEITITGTGWEPKGEFFQNKKRIIPLENKHLAKFLHISSTCNNSRLIREKNKEETYSILGDPTEVALIVLAEKAGIKKSIIEEKEKRIDDLPFSPELKYRASLSTLTEREGIKEISVIGAPEAVLQHSTHILKNGRKAKIIDRDIIQINKKIDELTSKARRVLALAYKEVSKDLKELSEKDTTELIFLGIVGMSDPPREEVKNSIAKAKRAGIRIIMATGDHKNTAIAVAKEINLVTEKNPSALTGAELKEMSEKDFNKAIKNVSIFARLPPEMKLKIAKTLQAQGHIIAMTGDGVNDAPALKQADIGISMGKIGTDVARESSDMILLDDDFSSIIDAVEEGRTVFINTRQTSFFLVNTGVAENATIVGTMALGMPLPLLPIQILWLNLVTNGITDVSLATEQPHHDVLQEPPKNQKENILNKETLPFMILVSGIMLVLTILTFNHYLPLGENTARTGAFIVMSFTQIFNMFNMRSLKSTIFKIGFFSNKWITAAFLVSTLLLILVIYIPFFQSVFSFTFIPYIELLILFALSSSVFWAGEFYKKFRNNKEKK